MDFEKVEGLMRKLLLQIGVSPDQEGLIQNAPYRMAHTLDYLTSGYRTDIDALLGQAVFTQEIDNMVICRDIELYSLCEHHMLPFFGRCHIGYIPKNGKILGISKLALLVDAYARRLQIQERITEQIAHKVADTIGPEGVGVVVEAQHLCMMMRGVEKQNSMLTSSTLLGSFLDSVATRDEFLTLIGRQHL